MLLVGTDKYQRDKVFLVKHRFVLDIIVGLLVFVDTQARAFTAPAVRHKPRIRTFPVVKNDADECECSLVKSYLVSDLAEKSEIGQHLSVNGYLAFFLWQATCFHWDMREVFGVVERAVLVLDIAHTHQTVNVHFSRDSVLARKHVDNVLVLCCGEKFVVSLHIVHSIYLSDIFLPQSQHRTAYQRTQQHAREKQCGKALFVPAPIFEGKAGKLLCGAAA